MILIKYFYFLKFTIYTFIIYKINLNINFNTLIKHNNLYLSRFNNLSFFWNRFGSGSDTLQEPKLMVPNFWNHAHPYRKISKKISSLKKRV
jgi:hypothetical protein